MKRLLPCLLGAAALILVSLTPSSASAGVRVGIGGWGGWGWGPGFGIYVGPRYGHYPYRRYYYGGSIRAHN